MANNNNPGKTNVNQVRQQNQQSMQKGQNANFMNEEFGSETDVNEVRKQNQQSEANKRNAAGQSANGFENETK